MILAALAGAIMAIQGSLNSVLGKVSGILEATFIVHITGTLLLVILLFIPPISDGNLQNALKAPWYTWLGGILGVVIVYTVAASIPQIGVATATTLIIVAQVSTALVIDHFGLFGLEKISFNWFKLIGMVLLAVGAKLMLTNPN